MTVYLGKNPVGIGRIVEKKVEKTMYGATLNDMFMVVDKNGTITKPTTTFDFTGTGIKKIGKQAWRYVLAMRAVKNIYFPDLEEVEGYGLSYFTPQAPYLKYLDMRKLRKVEGYALYLMNQNCQNLERANLDALEEITAAGGLASAFSGASKLTSFYFPSLWLFGSNNCMSGCFSSCTKITELHFLKEAQSSIEAQTGYSSKFGATNATIYFDLIHWFVEKESGAMYMRHESESIYDGDNKTYVAWLNQDDLTTLAYTQVGAEPTEGTPVYSDAGTTQIGTVEYTD